MHIQTRITTIGCAKSFESDNIEYRTQTLVVTDSRWLSVKLIHLLEWCQITLKFRKWESNSEENTWKNNSEVSEQQTNKVQHINWHFFPVILIGWRKMIILHYRASKYEIQWQHKRRRQKNDPALRLECNFERRIIDWSRLEIRACQFTPGWHKPDGSFGETWESKIEENHFSCTRGFPG